MEVCQDELDLCAVVVPTSVASSALALAFPLTVIRII